MAAFEVSKAVAAQGNAHTRLMAAIANGTAVRILFKGCPYMTAPSADAAEHILPRVGSPRRALYQVVAY
jgi:hypothetical protein